MIVVMSVVYSWWNTNAATVKTMMETPQNTENRITNHVTQLSRVDICPNVSMSTHHRDTCTPMFIVAIFTAAKFGTNLGAITTEEWAKLFIVLKSKIMPL